MESNANNNRSRKGQKRKLDDHQHRQCIKVTDSDDHDQTKELADCRRALITEIAAQVTVLGDSCYDRSAVKHATHVLDELVKNEEIVNLIVEGGAVPALVKNLVSPSDSSLIGGIIFDRNGRLIERILPEIQRYFA